MKRKLDLVVISDVHLGTYGCHAKELLQYLNSIDPQILVINGDFIDVWQFRKRYFPKEHMQVIRHILKLASKGTKVYYITGNHDDMLRRYTDFSTGNIHLRDKLILQLRGKTVWFFHGDLFDLSVRISPWLARLGGKSYDYLIVLNRFVNHVRKLFRLEPMSLAGSVKQRVKKAVSFISDFEKTAIELASKHEYDCVVCGHIHRPQMRQVTTEGRKITYLNSGDWVENLTALEYQWGHWSLYTYDAADYIKVNKRLRVNGTTSTLEDNAIPRESEVFDMDEKRKTERLMQQLLDAVS